MTVSCWWRPVLGAAFFAIGQQLAANATAQVIRELDLSSPAADTWPRTVVESML